LGTRRDFQCRRPYLSKGTSNNDNFFVGLIGDAARR
jgi:hypothetical protein